MKLTPKIKEEITRDWWSMFPLFGIYRPLWLMRRYGPILLGISLERDSGSDRYLPVSHFHNLASALPEISLTMPTRLSSERNNAVMKIQVKNHSRDWRDAAVRLKEQSFVPLELDAMTLSDAIGLYTKFIGSYKDPIAKYPIKIFEDIFALQILCGRKGDANASLRRARKVVDSWPLNIVKKFGGGEIWEQSVLRSYSSRSQLLSAVEQRIVDFELSAVPEGVFQCKS